MRTVVMHAISRFEPGGSLRQFIERLRAHPAAYEARIAALAPPPLDELRALGLPAPEVFPLRESRFGVQSLVQATRLAQHLRESNARLVHANDAESALIALIAGRMAGVRVIVQRGGKLRRWIARTADAVVVASEAERKQSIAEGSEPRHTFVIPDAIDLARFDALAAQPLLGPLFEFLSPSPHPGGKGSRDGGVGSAGGAGTKTKPVIAVVAHLGPDKGHRTLIAALRLAPLDARFAFVGDGPERVALEQLAQGLPVTFLGERADVPAILARADAFCLPSLADGLPDAVLEAMAARLPVIASGAPDLVDEESGFPVPPGDAQALAAALGALLRDPARARKLGEAGRDRIQRDYSLQRLAERHADLYDALLSAGQPRPTPG